MITAPESEHSPKAKRMVIGRYWRRILANVSDAVVVYDTHGRVVYANELVTVDLRYATALELFHQTIESIARRYAVYDDADQVLGDGDMPARRALEEGATVEKTLHFVPKSWEEEYWLIVKAFPIKNRWRQVKYVVAAYHDITAFKETELQLRETNRRMTGILEDLLKID